MREVLDALRSAGRPMAIATSKPVRRAAPIIKHLGLAEHFEFVGGDADDGSRGTKAMVIENVLDQFDRPDPSAVLMVGDRRQDVEGARTHGIDCIGADWGYAAVGELETAGAKVICASPTDLGVLLGPARH